MKMLFNLCIPAFIYVIFSIAHIIIDTYKGLYNTALLKFIVSVLFTIMLDTLCKAGLGIISWIIVFIPFIFMTLIVSILLYVFGLDVASGQRYNDKSYTKMNAINSVIPNPLSNSFSLSYSSLFPTRFSSDLQYKS
jgi:predicted membrane protein